MTNQPSFRPYKNVAVALLFSVILGPVGLLYASCWGGILMILVGIVVLGHPYFFPIVLTWLISAVLSFGAV